MDIKERLKEHDAVEKSHNLYERNELAENILESLRSALGDDLLCQIVEAPDRVVVLPCKVGEKLYVISRRESRVGNDYEYPDPCEECELYEHYEYELDGRTYETCKKSCTNECPTVVKPITVEVFEIYQDGKARPCYTVEYEGNSEITDWYATPEAAAAALKGADHE